jgi:hypothetical protein
MLLPRLPWYRSALTERRSTMARHYIEMTFFEASKETENKLRWDTTVGGAIFSQYIPKWRVPQPWPKTIGLCLSPRRSGTEDPPNLSPADVRDHPTSRLEPIVAIVRRFREHTKTLRYDPVGHPDTWEIGNPYIPYLLTFEESDFLRLIVLWDLATRGEFHSEGAIRESSMR